MGLVGKFLDGAGSLVQRAGAVGYDAARAAPSVARKVNSGLRKAGSEMLDARDDAIIKSMVKKTDPAFYNGYTGLKPTAGMNVAAVGLAGAWAYGGTLRAQTRPQAGTIEYEGQAPIMSGDGMQPTAGKAPTLGASGSLVFGLNAMRRG